ncbi:hypothetical protein CpecG_0533 [Chlamydia pecorum MC/MarsBar]|nr:hypothetical protein CpecG_0533 [Chlamydia pecorum MC/MarsBar]
MLGGVCVRGGGGGKKFCWRVFLLKGFFKVEKVYFVFF